MIPWMFVVSDAIKDFEKVIFSQWLGAYLGEESKC